MIQSEKQRLRREMLLRLREQPQSARNKKSEVLLKQLMKWDLFVKAKSLFCYVSLDYEVDTTVLIDLALKLGKRIVVPVISKEAKQSGSFLISEIRDRLRELEMGPFGIWQPNPQQIKPVRPDLIEIAIVPGIAFCMDGHRLGHGKGYFDRFLSQLSPPCLKVGIGFDFQLIPELPYEPHDVPLDLIVTDKEIIQIKK